MNNEGYAVEEERGPMETRSSEPIEKTQPEETRIEVEGLSVYYGKVKAVNNVSLAIKSRKVTAIIGPSGCGKSTFIRCLNRMHEVTPGARVDGKVLLDGEDLYGPGSDPVEVRRKIGMVFQKPNPFPTMSIRDNVIAGFRLNGIRDRRLLEEKVEKSLRAAAL